MKKVKPRNSIISNIKLTAKITIISILAITSSIVVVIAMIKGIYASEKKKHINMQKTIVTTSEYLVEMTIENSVNIAKSIYTNENIYSFLNTEYKSSSEYYDAFYQLQHSNPMSMAETNTVNNCTIYTENPTILIGGNISSFKSVTNTNWYHAYKKFNKPMILYIDPETNVTSIIRRLDFQNLDTGESCLKIDINMSVIKDDFDELNFNGKLYIINDGSLIYSNIPDTTMENIDINSDFECYVKNYYTSDIEYYAYENRTPIISFINENSVFIAIFFGISVFMIICGYIFNFNIKRRLKRFEEEIQSGIKYSTLLGNGKDEIGKFIDICASVAQKLDTRNNDFIRTNREFQQTNFRYNELFSTAMNLDTELYIYENYPRIHHRYAGYIAVDDEIHNIQLITNNITVSGNTDIKIPEYSLMMIAENLADESLSVNIVRNKDSLVVTFTRNTIKEQSRILKLRAIFEDGNITDEYSFIQNNPYNCYIRIMQCFEDRISVQINNKENFSLSITINSEKRDLI